MKKTAAVLTLVLAAACASSNANKKVNLQIAQINGPTSAQPVGPFDVQYGVVVENLTTAPITIRRIEIRQIGSGNYILSPMNPASYNFNKTIPAGATDGVSMWMHAYLLSPPVDIMGYEPVTIRAIVDFDSPSGKFHEIVHRLLSQFQ